MCAGASSSPSPPASSSSPTLSCSLQLLLASLVKLGRSPHLWQLSPQDRVSLGASCWPQLWALQLAQSGADPRALVAAPESALDPCVARLVRAAQELRALAPDHAEWTMMESLVAAGRGDQAI